MCTQQQIDSHSVILLTFKFIRNLDGLHEAVFHAKKSPYGFKNALIHKSLLHNSIHFKSLTLAQLVKRRPFGQESCRPLLGGRSTE